MNWLTLTTEPLDYARALTWASGPEYGGVVGFLGVVRSSAEERSGVTAIDYEAYEEHVLVRFEEVAVECRRRQPETGRIVVWHRIGTVPAGEASVVTVASAPHRAEAFDSCRYLIDAVKETAPVWKREHWPGGSDWSPAASAIRPVGKPPPS